jgi:glyoxylase-like metal-dependent hydrolase (beta-lactamase superfamily II)
MTHTLDLNFLGLENAIAAFLIETSDGPVLIETGPHSTIHFLEKAINKIGFELKDIKHVLLTHIHLDHAGAAWVFARMGAKIYVHPFGSRHLSEPTKLMESARIIYKEHMDRLWGQMESIPVACIHETQHLEEIKIGNIKITALHTPGHARHHIAWQIDETIYTGDVAGVKIQNGPVVPPCPPPDINLEDWSNSIQLLLNRKPSKLILTHYGEITNPEDHLSELLAILTDWAEWIKTRWEKGWSAEELTPLFSEYTASQLKGVGVLDSTLDQYEAANPSWMSVAGLIRYWKKKQEG